MATASPNKSNKYAGTKTGGKTPVKQAKKIGSAGSAGFTGPKK